LQRNSKRFGELKREIEQLEYFCKGTVLKRMMKCGKAHCACSSDPSKRHGPYFELTCKSKGKTVNVKLSPEAAPLYKAASRQLSKAQDVAQPSRKALSNHPPVSSQTGPVPARLIAKTPGYSHIPALSGHRTQAESPYSSDFYDS
jgi:hypothetical protein